MSHNEQFDALMKTVHKWEENDLVIWDNTQVMHRGRYFNDQKEIRDVRRSTIAGTEMLIDQ